MDIKKFVHNNIDKFMADFFYYGRKEDPDVSAAILLTFFHSGIITVDEVVDEFRKQLERNVQV